MTDQRPVVPLRRALSWLTAEVGPREGWALGLLLAVLSALPVLVAAQPQMTDYAAHLARFHVMLDGGQSTFLRDYYTFEWRWSGNLAADILIHPFAALFGLETGGRILVALIAPLTALAILTVDWTLRRRIGPASLFAFTFIWAPSLLMGFLNFSISLAAALFAFALWVRLDGWRWRWALFLPVGLVVWLCHVSGWGVLGIMVFGYEWHRSKSWRAFVAPLPLALPLLAVLLAAGGSGAFSYGPAPWIYKAAIWKQAMRDSVKALDDWTLWLTAGVLLGSLALRRIDGRLGWAAALMALASLVMPRHIFGGDYVDYRLISSSLLVGALALSWRPARWLVWLAPVLFLVRLAPTTADAIAHSARTEEALTLVDALPRGAVVASVVVTERGVWVRNPLEHIGGFAVVRRDALTNMHFALPGVHMLALKRPWPDFIDPSQRILHHRGAPIDLGAHPAVRRADYLWYVGPRDLATLPPGAQVIGRTRHALLARLAKAPPAS